MQLFRNTACRLRQLAWAGFLTAGTASVCPAQTLPALLPPDPKPTALPVEPLPITTAPAKAIDEPVAAAVGMPAVAVVPCPCLPPPAPKWQTPLPKVGMWTIPPTGCGYYSVLDMIRSEERANPPKYPYPRFGLIQQPNYDVNWSYLKDPNNSEHDYADRLKWIPIADGVTLNLGGDFRLRFMHEFNANNRIAGRIDAYELYRTRAYADLWVKDWLRFYGEFIYADYTNRDLPPLATDANRGDILNLFADIRTFEFGEKDNPVYLRIGRQELLYGSQRLVSPLEWVNARRTFQGVKAFTRTDKWDLDVFVVQPVLPAASTFDSRDHNQLFTGVWYTNRPLPGHNVDLYYMNLDNRNPGVAVGNGFVRGSYNVNTMGGRLYGQQNNWLWDAEGAFQFGSYSNQSIVAKMFSASGGYQFKDLAWNPQLWVGYDYASGDPDPQNSGTRRTFNQLFPFGHYYFGYTDIVARQNINDYFIQGVVYPAKWFTIITQYHVLRLDSNKDALYAPNGTILRQDRTGRAGNDIGNNLDIRGNIHLTNHSDVLFGYSRLFAGNYLRNTATGPNAVALGEDPELFYLQYTYRW